MKWWIYIDSVPRWINLTKKCTFGQHFCAVLVTHKF